jgi:hypothetical protein
MLGFYLSGILIFVLSNHITTFLDMKSNLLRRFSQLTFRPSFNASIKSYYDHISLGSNDTTFKVPQLMTQGK